MSSFSPGVVSIILREEAEKKMRAEEKCSTTKVSKNSLCWGQPLLSIRGPALWQKSLGLEMCGVNRALNSDRRCFFFKGWHIPCSFQYGSQSPSEEAPAFKAISYQ